MGQHTQTKNLNWSGKKNCQKQIINWTEAWKRERNRVLSKANYETYGRNSQNRQNQIIKLTDFDSSMLKT